MSVAHSDVGPWTLTDVLALPEDAAQRVESQGSPAAPAVAVSVGRSAVHAA